MGEGRRWRFKNLKTLGHFISTWWILVLIFIPTILVKIANKWQQFTTHKFHIEIYIIHKHNITPVLPKEVGIVDR